MMAAKAFAKPSKGQLTRRETLKRGETTEEGAKGKGEGGTGGKGRARETRREGGEGGRGGGRAGRRRGRGNRKRRGDSWNGEWSRDGRDFTSHGVVVGVGMEVTGSQKPGGESAWGGRWDRVRGDEVRRGPCAWVGRRCRRCRTYGVVSNGSKRRSVKTHCKTWSRGFNEGGRRGVGMGGTSCTGGVVLGDNIVNCG